MACCNVCYGKCVYGFKVEINTIPTNCPPPLFSKRADLAGRGGGSTCWNCTDSSAWAENPSKEECSRRGTVVT